MGGDNEQELLDQAIDEWSKEVGGEGNKQGSVGLGELAVEEDIPIPAGPVEAPGCSLCAVTGANCDLVLGTDEEAGYGCTNCRKLDRPCQYWDEDFNTVVVEPRPDGLTHPLCCDQCMEGEGGNIHRCSWRGVGSPSPVAACAGCVAKNILCTYMRVPAGELLDQYNHHSLTQTFPLPRTPRQVEQITNVRAGPPDNHDPNRARVGDTNWWDQSAVGQVPPLGDGANTRRPVCRTCRHLKERMRRMCNFVPAIRGCDTCTAFSVLCVVGNDLQAPGALTRQRRRVHGTCEPCRLSQNPHTNCDRQRPCDSCVYTRRTPGECHGGIKEGIFPRGAGVGVEVYPYLGAMGGGLRGVNDPNRIERPVGMPANFHRIYNNWLDNGRLPIPENVLLLPPREQQPPRPFPPFNIPQPNIVGVLAGPQ
ncbi:hypothetical protein GGS20DRAFT_541637 [Poronia punctata]|nr:hypothetical protein GGS20DRAFT_541637 [Poronia punctata]